MLPVRALGTGDLDPAWKIEKAVFAEDPWSRDQLAGELGSEESLYIGAYSGDELVAFGGVRGYYEADVMTLAVLPEWRGRGLAGRIVEELLRGAAMRDWDPVFLEVRESNVAARTLYRKKGFIELGKVRGYYRNPPEDAVRMGFSTDRAAFR